VTGLSVSSFPEPVVAALAAAALVLAAVPIRPRPRRREPIVDGRHAGAAPSGWTGDRRARRAPTPRAVADWCDDIVRQLRSGSSLRDAVASVPTDPAAARATAALRLSIERGAPLAEAAGRSLDGGTHLQLALTVITAASRIGGPSAAAIDRTAVVLRERAADLDDRATQAAQARLSAHVMTAVPLVMLALLVTTDDDVRDVVTSLIGAACVGTGLVLNAAGWWWMHRVVGARS
jgi:tight adherence protein B